MFNTSRLLKARFAKWLWLLLPVSLWLITDASVVAESMGSGSQDAGAENLIKNPSFENPSDKYIWIQNNWARNDVEFALDPVNPHSGKYSQRITLKKTTGGRPALELNYPKLPVTPGMCLRLAFWMRGPANSRPITVQIHKTTPPWTTYFSADVGLTDSWSQSTFNIVLPPNVDTKDTALAFTMQEENTYWVDDVSLTNLVIPEGPPVAGNQVRNGSFEVGRDHWYAAYREIGNDHGFFNLTKLATEAASDAPQGRSALRWDIPQMMKSTLTSCYFPIRPNHPDTVSFWVKAPVPGASFKISLNQGKFPNVITAGSKEFKAVDANWHRYDFAVTPSPSGSGTYFLQMDVTRAGTYLIDAVSVIEGTTPPAAYPAPPAEIGWGASQDAPSGNLFYENDRISFPLLARAAPGVRAVLVRLRIVDFREHELIHWSTNVTLDSAGYGQTDVMLPSNRFGGFKVEAYLGADAPGALPEDELIYSVVVRLKPAGQVADSFFGAHCRLTPYNLDVADRLGVRWLRLNWPLTTKWMTVEPEKGHFDFYTDGVKYARSRGFHILGMFDTTPWFYADGDPALTRKSAPYDSFGPKDWNAWRTYVQKTSEAYAPYIHDWEIWNEPDGGFLQVPPGKDKAAVYAKIVHETRAAVEDGHFDFNLVGGCEAHLVGPFTLKQLQLGAGGDVDTFSFHLYTEERSPDEAKPALADMLTQLRQFTNRSGKVPELWDTEGGMWVNEGRSWRASAEIPTSAGTNIADTTNATIRMIAGLKALGVKKFFYYGTGADPWGRICFRDECSGLIDIQGTPNPAGAAYAAAVCFLESADPVGLDVKDVGRSKVSLARFRAGDKAIAVLWSRTPAELGSIPDLDWTKASGYDLFGNPVDLSEKTAVTIDPIYFIRKL